MKIPFLSLSFFLISLTTQILPSTEALGFDMLMKSLGMGGDEGMSDIGEQIGSMDVTALMDVVNDPTLLLDKLMEKVAGLSQVAAVFEEIVEEEVIEEEV